MPSRVRGPITPPTWEGPIVLVATAWLLLWSGRGAPPLLPAGVLLGLVGAHLSVAIARAGALGALRAAWRSTWPTLLVVLAGAVAWLAVESSTTADRSVRGQVLALVTGTGGWWEHARAVAGLAPPTPVGPTVGTWIWSVAAQAALLVVLLAAVAGRYRREAWAAGAVILATWAVVLPGTTELRVVVLDGRVAAAAVLAGAAVGSRRRSTPSEQIGAAAAAGALLLAGALDLAGRGRPGLGLVVALVPAVGAAVAATAGTVIAPSVRRRLDDLRPGIAVGPAALGALALAAPVRGLLATAGVDVGGPIGRVAVALTAAAAGIAVGAIGPRLAGGEAAVERRRVLVPPVAAVLVLAVFLLSGAFRWHAPRPLTPEEIRTSTIGSDGG